MGNWDISIKGVGQHHNASAKDAEQMAAKFVDALREAGHAITSAVITTGGATDLVSKFGLMVVGDDKEEPK